MDAPIGFFDSGLGGAAVLATAVSKMPHENFIYYGDNAFAPYGTKSSPEIFARAGYCVDFLLDQGVKAIVIACNTATGVAVKQLREKYQLPIISMEPAVKLGMKYIASGKILVLATPATLVQEKYLKLVESLGVGNGLISLPCDGLVELIEAGKWDAPETIAYLRAKLLPLKEEQIDAVVLGCTHYVFVKPIVAQIFAEMGKNSEIVDGSEGTVNHLCDLLAEKNQRKVEGKRTITLYTSGDKETVFPLFRRALLENKDIIER